MLRANAAAYPRRVLLAVSGLSPQIVSETIYALAVASPETERFVPTEVQVVTTAEGAARIRDQLLARPDGAFHRLRRDYRLGPIAFDVDRVRSVNDSDGQELIDIRSAEDNACLADAITERVRALTADEECALHVSLAGGRKTMGYYAGYALSLFGRPQDRLSHVLVNEPFESAPEFWYPPPQPTMLRIASRGAGKKGITANTADARVSLAMIPFVRLRQGLPKALLEGHSGFAAAVAAATGSLAAPQLRLHLADRTVEADGQRMVLQPAPFAFVVALASRALQGKPALPAPPKEVHDPAWAAEVVDDMRRVYGLMEMPLGAEESLLEDSSGTRISPMVSRLRRGLSAGLAPSRLSLYFDDGGTHRHKRYAVPLPAAAISVIRPRGGAKAVGKLAASVAGSPTAHTHAARGQTPRGDDE